jgi:hypothetical protein
MLNYRPENKPAYPACIDSIIHLRHLPHMNNDLDDRLRALMDFDSRPPKPHGVRWRRATVAVILAGLTAWAGLAIVYGIGGL